ncbi:MAG: hypothetical protein ACR2NO_08235, partial [Chloroflexota bacterium]
MTGRGVPGGGGWSGWTISMGVTRRCNRPRERNPGRCNRSDGPGSNFAFCIRLIQWITESIHVR